MLWSVRKKENMSEKTSFTPPSDVTAASVWTDGGDFEELERKIRRAVLKVCPPSLSDQRDDLVQIALVKVMEICRRDEGKRQFNSSYLWKVAYSALIDELRRRRRRSEVSIDDEDQSAPLPDGRATPDERFSSHELGAGIHGCLAGLLEARRLAVTLHLQGYSVPEAAKLLEWPAKRTENLIYRGLADLRRCLTERGFRP